MAAGRVCREYFCEGSNDVACWHMAHKLPLGVAHLQDTVTNQGLLDMTAGQDCRFLCRFLCTRGTAQGLLNGTTSHGCSGEGCK